MRPALVPIGAGLVGFGLFSWTLLQRADALLLPAYDNAFFQNVVWNVGHGGGFSSSLFAANFLGLHFEPLIVVPALLERLWANVRLLLILNALALAATAPAAFFFLCSLLGDARHWIAAALAAPLPFWAATQQAAIAGFHTEALALPLVLLAGWAGLSGRWMACWGLALAALTAKEDQAYGVAVMGTLLAFRGPSRRHAAALIGAAVVWGALAELWVMPALLRGVVSQTDSYYRWLHSASAGEIARALGNPAGWLAFAAMVASLAGLPLLEPAWLLLALPPLTASLLSAHYPQPELRLQYGLPLVVPLVVAAGLGARRLPERLPRPAIAALSVPAVAIGALSGPIIDAHASTPAAVARLQACTMALPDAAPLAVDDASAAPLASRPSLRLLSDARAGDFALVDRLGRVPSYIWLPDRDRVIAELPSQKRRLICDDGRFQLWSPAGA